MSLDVSDLDDVLTKVLESGKDLPDEFTVRLDADSIHWMASQLVHAETREPLPAGTETFVLRLGLSRVVFEVESAEPAYIIRNSRLVALRCAPTLH